MNERRRGVKSEITADTKSIWPILRVPEIIGETLTKWKARINSRINLLRNLRSFSGGGIVDGETIVLGTEKELEEQIDKTGSYIRVWRENKNRDEDLMG